jgi:ribosome biogenesis GTPase
MAKPAESPGRVVRIHGTLNQVQTPDGRRYDCVVRGKFRIKGLDTTHPVAVGDEVEISLPEGDDPGVIQQILPRRNYLLRKAIAQGRKYHMLAANLDQAALMFSLDQPATSLGFANRFLTSASAYDIPGLVVINKIDLLPEHRWQEVADIYERAGYPVLAISSLDPARRAEALEWLRDKVTFIGGHSGAGKSTFINLLDPSLDIRTGNISEYSNKGKHTTTYAEMHPLAFGGWIIDSPGIKELGMADMKPEELAHYLPEMAARLGECRFHDCKHRKEPGCAVRKAVENGSIHPSRYDSYLRMLEELEQDVTF